MTGPRGELIAAARDTLAADRFAPEMPPARQLYMKYAVARQALSIRIRAQCAE